MHRPTAAARRALPTLLALLLLLGLAPAPDGAAEELVDRIVAVVDDDPIFLSDVERVLGLGFVDPAPGESAREVQRRVLDRLIAQRLRFHEVDRYDFGPLPVDEIERQVAEIRARFSDEAAYQEQIRRLGLDDAGVRNLVARQLRVLTYIEERLGPRIFVDVDDVRAYYEGELSAKAAREGVALPPLAEIRQEIRAILREVRLNEEIEAWTEELRQAADVVDLFDRAAARLPPVVERFGVGAPQGGGDGVGEVGADAPP